MREVLYGYSVLLALVGTTLAAEPTKQKDRATIIRGQVLLPNGEPAASAEVTIDVLVPDSARGKTVVNRQFVRPERAKVTCNEQGKFLHKVPGEVVKATATVPGALTGGTFPLIPGDVDNVLSLIVGSRVTGRVLLDGRGVAGVPVVAVTRRADSPADQHQVVTDDDGKFAVERLYPGEEYCVFLPMRPLADKNLAAIKQYFRSAPNGQATELPEINLHPANTVRGRLVLPDNKRLPSELAVTISRAEFDDEQRIHVDEDGAFMFHGVPRDAVRLWVAKGTSVIRVYGLAPQNQSLDAYQTTDLCGRVDEDLDLVVLLTETVWHRDLDQSQRGSIAQVRPVAVRLNGQPQPGQVFVPNPTMNSAFVQQFRLLSEPLRGVTGLRDIEAAERPAR